MSQPKDTFDKYKRNLESLEDHLSDTVEMIYSITDEGGDDVVIRAVKDRAKACIRALEDLRPAFQIYTDLILFMQGFTEEDNDEGAEGEQDVVQGDQ